MNDTNLTIAISASNDSQTFVEQTRFDATINQTMGILNMKEALTTQMKTIMKSSTFVKIFFYDANGKEVDDVDV